MKSHLLWIGLALCAVLALLLPRENAVPPSPAAGRSAETARPATRRISHDRTPAASEPTSDPARFEDASAVIQQAMTTYAPAGIHPIRPFLTDPDPTIRQAARDGLVQLGEPDAIPHLRAAAAKLVDPAEIASLHEAADLLALPAWSESAEARAAVAEITGETPP
jgi:hypothetical protein